MNKQADIVKIYGKQVPLTRSQSERDELRKLSKSK